MNCILHVIGTDTVDLTPSLVLVCGNRKYLFNAGEGTQRLCLEHFVRMGQLDTVLFTRLDWEEIGGFPGMILTTAETGMRALTVCGPPGIEDFLTSTRFFLQRDEFVMHIREFKGGSPPPYVDNQMRIYPIVLDPSIPPPTGNQESEDEESEEETESDTREASEESTKEIEENNESQERQQNDGSDSDNSSGSAQSESDDQRKREPLTGIAYIPTARKNQRVIIRRQNVEQVVSLMFSKRRQQTEHEELESQVEYYNTGYEGRHRRAKKAKKDEHLNFKIDTEKMRLACHDPKLLVHEDFFGANPDMTRDAESDGEPDTVLGPNLVPVGVVPDTTQVGDRHSAESINNNNTTTTSAASTQTHPNSKIDPAITPPISATSPPILPAPILLPPPQTSTSVALKIGVPFDNTSLTAFPSISTKPACSLSSIGSSLFRNAALQASPFGPTLFTSPLFGRTTPQLSPILSPQAAAPFGSSLFTSPFTDLPPSSTPSSSTVPPPNQATDIFGKQSSSETQSSNASSLFVNPTSIFELASTKFGNSSLFEEKLVNAPIPVPIASSPVEPASTSKRSDIVLCYACHMQDIIRLDYNKALAFGVSLGPILDELREGKTVQSETTGNLVSPQDCMSDPIPGPTFLVIHCPSLDYIPYIIYNEIFEAYFDQVEFVVHLTHHDALSTDVYKNWMHKFNTIEHIIINKEVCTHHHVYPTSAVHQYRMNSLHNDIFPLPFYKEPTAVLPNKCNCCCGAELAENRVDPRDFNGLPANTSVGEIFLQMVLYPHYQQGVDRSGVVLRGSIARGNAGVHQLANVPDLGHAVEQLRLTCADHESNNPIPCSQPRLLFLGTASALPSKYRNVSGIYFEPIPGSGMLLDAGEGSYGMLYRRFGEKLDEVIISLKAAWISHIHADHHLGLIRILLRRRKCHATSPLMVIGPRPVGRWLSEYDQKIQTLFYDFVDCADVSSPRNFITPFFESVFGLKEIYTMEVRHCAEAFGLVMTHKDGWKLSGDTRPCPKIEEEGKDAFLLIHEATFETGSEEHAHQKGHSTCGQALECFKRMNAQWVILTHFSPRYPSIPILTEEARDKVGIAFDLMDIRWSDIPILPHLLKPMRMILDHEEQSRSSTAQRTRDYYEQREKKLVAERARAKRIKYHFLEDDEEEEKGETSTYYNRFSRGRGGVRGFSIDPTKRRGKVDR